MVNKPLVRPAISWGVGGIGVGVTSHDRFPPKCSVLKGKWDPENFREI